MQAPLSQTVLDTLLASLQNAADFNHDDTVAPAAILWPDEKREWAPLLPRLRAVLPHFLTFRPYDPVNRSGPAIWLRCVLAGKVPEVSWPSGAVPVVYLPGVGRATLRATDECPSELKPIAELQYRGVFWSQANGKDWTIPAFFQTNHGGLQLKVAKDQATAMSLRRAIEKLVDVSVAELTAKSASGNLNSGYFDSYISDDIVDDLLSWLADPKGARQRWDSNRWEMLCGRCNADYGFDPGRDGEVVGAEKLAVQQKTAWKTAWKRFAAAPTRYHGLTEQLRRAKSTPKGHPLLAGQFEEAWPQDNEAEELALRKALLDAAALNVEMARKTLLDLEEHHKRRREWVWARLNLAPLAHAIKHLATLAASTQMPLTGATLNEMVKAYTESGWQADAAVLDALVTVSHPKDRDAVRAAIDTVYAPWLRDAAELFQQRAQTELLPGRAHARLGKIAKGTCILFVDGLRYDIGQKLKLALELKLGAVQLNHQFVALPSATPTAKPAVSPVAGKIKGSTAGEEFRPCLADGKDLTIDRFRALMEEDGYQILPKDETGEPAGRAWAEVGELDSTGHAKGIGLADRIPELIANLVHRIEALLEAGWREIRIVTDHGWLLLPKGLPKVELPKYLTATRWGRCAVVKPSATVELPCFSWFWDEDVRIACPTGIGCFIDGREYSHGGLSLQECVVPQMTIQAGKQQGVSARIDSFKWGGLRCRIKVDGAFEGCKMDLRDKAADSESSLTGAKTIGQDGSVALMVADDAREGSATFLVLLDPAGDVLEKQAVTVGG